jgi:deoxycytidine triphosphate deaminase
MYLSDRDIRWAISRKALVIEAPEGTPPPKVDPTSVDLRLDGVREAKISETEKLKRRNDMTGHNEAEIHLGSFKFGVFAEEYLISPPAYERENLESKVCLRGNQIVVRSGGFLLWQTKEKIGTPKKIHFIYALSMARAREPGLAFWCT